ncbi:hypothetical protein ABWK57_31095, partial [Streptomyces sp. NPDC094045]|uniref:hypothetical protein n=1 Tax=Streptomyces sp. NPDC094045 TaxID=3161019 RepID=UPI0033973933
MDTFEINRLHVAELLGRAERERVVRQTVRARRDARRAARRASRRMAAGRRARTDRDGFALAACGP